MLNNVEFENLRLNQLDDHIFELVLSQPTKRNALNAQMWADLPIVLDQAAAISHLKVLIVKGDGEHFSSGADITEFGALYKTKETSKKISTHISKGFNALANFSLPTLAQISGACVGGGCGLALCCDIRFADQTSKFAITPAKLGLVYPFSDVRRLIEVVGVANAKDILFSARSIAPEEARAMGLINRLFASEDLESETLAYARGIAGLSSQSAEITKKMFMAYQSGQSRENAQSRDWFFDGFTSPDFKEGYQAFLEKRKPNFD